MLILWGLVGMYIITFFCIMGLVGAGYAVSFAVRRARSHEPASRRTLPGGVRRACSEDALKAA